MTPPYTCHSHLIIVILVVGAVSHSSPDHGDALAAKDADTLAPGPWSVLVRMPVQLALLSVKQLWKFFVQKSSGSSLTKNNQCFE